MPRGSEHQSCTDTGQPSDPSDDYKPRAALKGTHFLWDQKELAYISNLLRDSDSYQQLVWDFLGKRPAWVPRWLLVMPTTG